MDLQRILRDGIGGDEKTQTTDGRGVGGGEDAANMKVHAALWSGPMRPGLKATVLDFPSTGRSIFPL